MKIAAVGDLHFGHLPYFIASVKSRADKVEKKRIEMIKEIVSAVTGYDKIILLGDLLHKGAQSTLTVTSVGSLIYLTKSLSKELDNVRVILGNHDLDSEAILKLLYPKVITEITFEDEENFQIVYMPYGEKFSTLISKLDPKDQRPLFLFMHIDLQEYWNQPMIGESWLSFLSVIKPRRALGINGHLHTRRLLRSCIVVGAPFDLTFNSSIPITPVTNVQVLDALLMGGVELIDTEQQVRKSLILKTKPLFLTADCTSIPSSWIENKLEEIRDKYPERLIFLEVIFSEKTYQEFSTELVDGLRVRVVAEDAKDSGSSIKTLQDFSKTDILEEFKNALKNKVQSAEAKAAVEKLFSDEAKTAILKSSFAPEEEGSSL